MNRHTEAYYIPDASSLAVRGLGRRLLGGGRCFQSSGRSGRYSPGVPHSFLCTGVEA